jgi:hypothetical protein
MCGDRFPRLQWCQEVNLEEVNLAGEFRESIHEAQCLQGITVPHSRAKVNSIYRALF